MNLPRDTGADRVRMIEGVAREMLGHGVAVVARDPRADQPGLMPAEAPAVASAIAARQREFACGRAAARAALAQIGIHGRPVPCGDDRAPVWPEGAVGSISHTDTLCLAAVGASGSFQSIGLDIEGAEALPRDLWDSVLTAPERARLETLPEAERGRSAKLIFAAKECAFKCQYPLTGALFGFDALEITLDPAQRLFHASPADGGGAGPMPDNPMSGRYVIFTGHVLATMVLRR